MPIPIGARQVPGNPNRVQLASGDIVTRAKARTLGAQELGFKSARGYTKEISQKDANYYKAFLNTTQGRAAMQKAKQEGLKPNEFKTLVIAARNGRAHPKSGKRATATNVRFMTHYINDSDNYDIGDT